MISQMAAHGIHLPSTVDLGKAFSRFLRFRPEGVKGTKKSAWARLHEHTSPTTSQRYISGAYGIWRGTVNESFTVEAVTADWSPADRAAWLETKKKADREAAQARSAEAETAAEKAQRFWKRSRAFGPATPPHPYLETKRVGAFGVRLGFNDRLLVPVCDVQGTVHGLQYIAADGSKIFGTGTLKEGRSHLLGACGDAANGRLAVLACLGADHRVDDGDLHLWQRGPAGILHCDHDSSGGPLCRRSGGIARGEYCEQRARKGGSGETPTHGAVLAWGGTDGRRAHSADNVCNSSCQLVESRCNVRRAFARRGGHGRGASFCH